MYKSFVSLETRILLLTGVKTFCPCGYTSAGKPETCPICRSEGDARPALNQEAALRGYLAAKALGCRLSETAAYERHLGSPEMPPDRPLSGYSVLLGADGFLETSFHGKRNRVRVAEVRIEEDAGRLIHSAGGARMDYGHAGMPSLRIRTEADFEIGEEAELFLQELWARLSYLGVATGAPKESVIRCNAYVALTDLPELAREYVKLRNLNSHNFVRKAINYELGRQEEILERGEAYEAESRLWNEAKSVTESWQRRRPEAKGRFAPAAGVPAFAMPEAVRARLRDESVELPGARALRFMREHSLNSHQARALCEDRSRADYFEASLRHGASPVEAAHWLISDLAKIQRREGAAPEALGLGPESFAWVLKLLADKRIHAPMARQLLWAAALERKDPAQVLEERGWARQADPAEIERAVTATLAERREEVERIAAGEAKPVHRLVGEALAKLGGAADPARVREAISRRLDLSFILVVSMGGAISGSRNEGGAVDAGDERALRELIQSIPCDKGIRIESAEAGRMLSEEITPADWAALVTMIAEALEAGGADGIVVAHGTDTLPYTASLLYWLFSDAAIPIVLTASSKPPSEGDEARRSLEGAIAVARSRAGGVYVALGDRVLSPLNLKFLASGPDGFRNWNMPSPAHSGPSILGGGLDADKYVLTQLLEEAIDRSCVVKVYPGMKADFLIALMNAGVKWFILELYDTGTANLRESPFSLRAAFLHGKRRGVKFFCTSQQEGIVDFSRYISSRGLWKGGAVPMGPLATESAYTMLLAASLIAESDEELAELMELRSGL